MSVTFTEREALRQLIEYIKEERQRLFEEHVKAVSKLAELDRIDNVHPEINRVERDIKPVTKVDVESVISRQEDKEEEKEAKIKPEPEPEPESEYDVEATPNEAKASMTLLEAIKKHNELHEEKQEESSTHNDTNTNINSNSESSLDSEQQDMNLNLNLNLAKEIELQKEYDSKNHSVVKTPTRQSNYKDIKQISKDIAHFVKNSGRPVKTSEIIGNLKDRGITTNNPYSLLHQALNYEPKIQRVKHGFYQYKW